MSYAFWIYSVLLRLHGNCLRKTFFQGFLNLLQCNLFRNSSNFLFLDCSRLFLSYFYSVEHCEQPRDRCYGSKSSDIGATCLGYYLISLQPWSSHITFWSPFLRNFKVLKQTILKLIRQDKRTNAMNLNSYLVPMTQRSMKAISSNVDNLSKVGPQFSIWCLASRYVPWKIM